MMSIIRYNNYFLVYIIVVDKDSISCQNSESSILIVNKGQYNYNYHPGLEFDHFINYIIQ